MLRNSQLFFTIYNKNIQPVLKIPGVLLKYFTNITIFTRDFIPVFTVKKDYYILSFFKKNIINKK